MEHRKVPIRGRFSYMNAILLYGLEVLPIKQMGHQLLRLYCHQIFN